MSSRYRQISVALVTVAALLQSNSLYAQEEQGSVSSVLKNDTQSKSTEIKPVKSPKSAKPKPKFKMIHRRDGIMVGARPWGDSEYPEYLV